MDKSSISKADSLEKIGEFWDNHDFTDFDDPNAPDVDFYIAIPVELDLLNDNTNGTKNQDSCGM